MVEKNPKISVIVPVYNVQKYLRRCIDSIINQTFKNFEIILVDDGSTDECPGICDEYAQKYNYIRVLHGKNGGLPVARNRGIKIASGEWICFVDSDDLIHPQMIEFLYKAAVENNVKLSGCYRLQSSTVPDDFFEDLEYNCKVVDTDDSFMMQSFLNSDNIYWVAYVKLVKKDIIKKYQFTENRIFEDNGVAFKWLYEAKRISILPLKMYFYTDNPNGIMNSKFSLKRLDYLWALEEQIRFYDSLEYNGTKGVAAKEYIDAAIWFYKRVMDELNDEDSAKKILVDVKRVIKEYNLTTTAVQKQKIEKYLHPRIYRIKRILKRKN